MDGGRGGRGRDRSSVAFAIKNCPSAIITTVLIRHLPPPNSPTSAKLQRLVSELAKQVPQLYLWAACLGNTDIPPELQPEVKMTLPLRCAPVVQREIRAGIRRFSIHDYTDEGVVAPGDGMSVVRLLHRGGAHTVQWPVDCFQCGKDVAAELRRLGVGVKGKLLTVIKRWRGWWWRDRDRQTDRQRRRQR